MLANFLAVDPQLAGKVYRSKMQVHHFILIVANKKGSAVPKFFVRLKHVLHPRKPGFWRIRHQDLFLKRCRLRSIQILNGAIPPAVEVLPVSADQLRAWVFG